MSPPPALRSVHAQTTPPPPTDTVTLLARVQAHWKPVGALLLALVMAVTWALGYDSRSAKKTDVAAEHSFAADIARDMHAIDKRVTHQEERGEWRDAVLKSIADKVGAVTPPLPPPVVP